MRIAYWSPLPPQKSGIADYSYELLSELRELVDVVAVTSWQWFEKVRVPDGVELVKVRDGGIRNVDLNVYQMGNNPPFHGFMLQELEHRPGLMVLHDPSLVDFYISMCGGQASSVFREEVTYNCPEIGPFEELPTVPIPGRDEVDLDRMRLLLCRRLVESSARTLVHSKWIRDELRQRFPGNSVEAIQLAAPRQDPVPRDRGPGGVVTFGVFGGISYYKRVVQVAEAFAVAYERQPNIRLVIAGRVDDKVTERELRAVISRPELARAVEIFTDLSLSELEATIASCDVAISLRWPTAGEMSATLLRALAAGRPAILSDVPQFGELDERFCWRVPLDLAEEHERLVGLLTSIGADPLELQRAGDEAQKFVMNEATYDIVARSYVEHITACIG